MNVHYSTNLLHKANGILELITRVDSKLNYHYERLKAYDKSSPYDFVCLFYNRAEIVQQINNYKYIRTRLKTYYVNTLANLAKDAIHEFNPINN